MMTTELMNAAERNDADLVAESLRGSRDAFHRIVERYKTLICSLAYSATGNLSQSEDVAQETFLAAWSDLRTLREPDKLRSWLCGIVRNRIHRSLRNSGREPVCQAMALEDAPDSPAMEALPSQQAITREEEAILWRSMERVPELYREPLILFYREDQSIEHVAAALELTEDAVKQRLPRGRKLLQEEVQAFVENTLRRTAPGQAFSGAVLAALPLAAGPMTTAGLGVGAKGTAAAKSGLLAVWLWPFIGFFAGFASQWMVVCATTPKHERLGKLLKLIVTWVVLLGIPIVGESSVYSLEQHWHWSDQVFFASLACFWSFWCICIATWLILSFRQQLAIVRQRDEDSKASGQTAPALTPVQSAFLAAGLYLCMFSWFISLTWREHDRITAAIVTGASLVMGVGFFLRQRAASGEAALRGAYRNTTLCCALIVAVINLRIDVWAAAKYGVSVAEVHTLLPLWIVPLLTFILAAWIAAGLALTKQKTFPLPL